MDGSPEVTFIDDHQICLRTNAWFHDYFAEKQVFFGAWEGQTRFRPEDEFRIRRYVQLERYASIFHGNEALSIGAFSYSHSLIPPGLGSGDTVLWLRV